MRVSPETRKTWETDSDKGSLSVEMVIDYSVRSLFSFRQLLDRLMGLPFHTLATSPPSNLLHSLLSPSFALVSSLLSLAEVSIEESLSLGLCTRQPNLPETG